MKNSCLRTLLIESLNSCLFTYKTVSCIYFQESESKGKSQKRSEKRWIYNHINVFIIIKPGDPVKRKTIVPINFNGVTRQKIMQPLVSI